VSHALLACNFGTTVQLLQQQQQHSAYSSQHNSRSSVTAAAAAAAAADRSYVVFKFRKELCPVTSSNSIKSSNQCFAAQQQAVQSKAGTADEKCIEVSCSRH
jgi:hypothetical protein